MKRLLFILLLSGIFCSAAAQELTYEQLQSFKSKKEYKNLKITSYTASDGQTYSIGDQLTLGHKYKFLNKTIKGWGGIYPINVFNMEGKTAIIKKFKIKGSPKKGLRICVPFKSKAFIAIMSYGMAITDLDKAITIGEVISKGVTEFNNTYSYDNGASTETIEDVTNTPLQYEELSYFNLEGCEGGNYTSYTASNGAKFIVGESNVVLGHTFENKYEYTNAKTEYAGNQGVVTSIYVNPKSKNKVVEMEFAINNGKTVVRVKSVEDAIANSEIYLY